MQKPKELFLSDGGCILGSELQYLNHGANADVWKWSSKDGVFAVKTFYPEHYIWAIDKNIADIFMDLCFHNLPNLYYTCSRNKTADKKLFDGYVMEYLEEDAMVSLLDIPSSNLYRSIYNLEQDIDLISSYGVVLDDVKVENSMITTDSMFHLLDYDLSYIDSSCSEDKINRHNRNETFGLVRFSLLADLVADIDFTEEEKNRMLFFLIEQLYWERCYQVKLSDVVGDLFCNDATPRDTLKKRVKSLESF